ncbi:hypothetical protein EGT74_00550 [Chitinophaga lutea]|uniref:DUF2306 domain-containing protein n=1 Tax=Chitinophaga lutea TaxID=2488634 RepID=A0A3N4PTV7_9BACT|nr:hypothetical protein [Chitinophaga lutea]RPE12082.1 hypothetical protein EGT74_00550 [Chitinophaga lutea]
MKKENEQAAGAPRLKNQLISHPFTSGMIIGSILLIILVHIGFYKTYISHFPYFKDYTVPGRGIVHFNAIIHFHGMMMAGWFFLLLVQPVLILKGKIKLHRLAGRMSYVLAPLMLLSMYLVIHSSLDRALAAGQIAATARRMALDVPAMIFFAILYLLAIFSLHKPALHGRLMCSTAFVLISPALGRTFRVFLDASRDGSIDLSRNVIVIVVAVIAAADSWRTKRISPFVLVLGFVILNKIIWNIRDTSFWQPIAHAMAKVF